jgi:DNA uptake protein ComE-like DNA-binding protein
MFNLTRQEQQVILFLVSVALVGVGVNFWLKEYAPVQKLISFDANITKTDLNQADKDALITIPGIGEKLAQRILDYRSSQGGFNELAELRNIKGITPSRYEKLKGLLYIRD